jgi:hypothetical protein
LVLAHAENNVLNLRIGTVVLGAWFCGAVVLWCSGTGGTVVQWFCDTNTVVGEASSLSFMDIIHLHSLLEIGLLSALHRVQHHYD